MPFPKVLRSEFIDHRKNTTNYELRTQNCKPRGFTLLELLVVITLFALSASLVVAAYSTFARNDRLKNAALTLKNDIRFAQNKALSGDKGAGGVCAATSTLGGWYLELATASSSSYRISGVCLSSSFVETDFAFKTINLPSQVTISSIAYSSSQSEVNILFRPLSYDVSVFGTMTSVDFYNTSGNLNAPLSPVSDLVISLAITGSSSTYKVIVKPSGEVNENKP